MAFACASFQLHAAVFELVHIILFVGLPSMFVVCEATPVQWESIPPVGQSPPARYGHSMAVLQSVQGMPILYGGSQKKNGSEEVLCDLWKLDSVGKYWREVKPNENNASICAANRIQGSLPGCRSGHTMISVGSAALMCGGYVAKRKGAYSFRDASQLDCWFLKLTPVPYWEPVSFQGTIPAARWGHSMSFDEKTGHALLFGGVDSTGIYPMDDCWFVLVGNADALTYEWQRCQDPVGLYHPSARFGHGTVFHSGTQSFFVFGGFVYRESSVVMDNSLWALIDFTDKADVHWEEIYSNSQRPMGRGFHSMWLLNSQLFVHGGQGWGGQGTSSVFSDTWTFDVHTLVWSKFGSSESAPAASHMPVIVVFSADAYGFGGFGPQGQETGRLSKFQAGFGWTTESPVGSSPPARTGHVLFYDSFQRLFVSLGVSYGPSRLDDLWSLDLTDGRWTCLYGPSPPCSAALPALRPQARAFPMYASSGLVKLVLGGMLLNDQLCAAHPLKFGNAEIVDDLWLLDSVAMLWSQIAQPSVRPEARMMGAMESIASLKGYRQPVVLVGGASILKCSVDSSSCDVLQPMNDVWLLDAGSKSADDTHKMATFDGKDDVIEIILPTWCSSSASLSLLHFDSWIYIHALNSVPMIILDAYSNSLPVLRLYLERRGGGTFVSLLLHPGKVEVLVKTWGPINETIVGRWHHICLTLRFGRVLSSLHVEPDVVVAQAFLFVDGGSVGEAGRNFEKLDIKRSLRLSAGLTTVYLGGSRTSKEAEGYQSLQGNVDQFRLWWPSCPSSRDPSRCDPYAFLYPILQDGTRVPSAADPTSGRRLTEADVEMRHVAYAVLESMFQPAVAPPHDSDVLVDVKFDDYSTGDGRFLVNSAHGGPSGCAGNALTSFCDGCPFQAQCTFGNCGNFDLDCVQQNMKDLARLARYADEEDCECLDILDCPTAIRNCRCPPNLHRTCKRCYEHVRICEPGGELCFADGDSLYNHSCSSISCPMPQTIHHLWCPAELCEEWECSCFEPSSLSGLHASQVAVEQGVGICDGSCPAGLCVANNSQLATASGLSTVNCCELIELEVAGGGEMCRQWETRNESGKTRSFCVDSYFLHGNCEIERCCVACTVLSGATAPTSSSSQGFLCHLSSSSSSQLSMDCSLSQQPLAVGDKTIFLPLKREEEDSISLLRREDSQEEPSNRRPDGSHPHELAATLVKAWRRPAALHEGRDKETTGDGMGGVKLRELPQKREEGGRSTLRDTCGPGFEWYPLQGCVCKNRVAFSLSATETSRVQGENNTITLRVNFLVQQPSAGLPAVKVEGNSSGAGEGGVLVLLFQGLTGTQTPDSDQLPLSCRASGPTLCRWNDQVDGDCSGLRCSGVRASWSSAGVGVGEWRQGSGTLKVTVTRDIWSSAADPLPFLELSFTVRNPPLSRPPAFPVLSMCGLEQRVSNSSGLLSSSVWIVRGLTSVEVRREDDGGRNFSVASLRSLGDASDVIRVLVSGRPSSSSSPSAWSRLPQGTQIVSMTQSLLETEMEEGANGSLLLVLYVNSSARDRQGGCVLDSRQTLRICLRGVTFLAQFEPASALWINVTAMDGGTVSNESLRLRVSSSSIHTLLSSPQCCSLNGTAKACGDKICLPDGSRTETVVLLGQETFTRMPAVQLSSRPPMRSQSDLVAYLEAPPPYQPRQPWRQLCADGAASCSSRTTRTDWFPARLGHAVAVVGSKLFVYGGVGCGSWASGGETCRLLSAALDDLWEVDLDKFFSGLPAVAAIATSPKLSGLSFHTMLVFELSQIRLVVYGGEENNALPMHVLLGETPPTSNGTFRSRELSLWSRAAKDHLSDLVPSSSGCAMASNSTHAFMLGGFVQNSLTSSLLISSLSSLTPESSASLFPIIAESPSPRAFAGVSHVDAAVLVMYGGEAKRQGLHELWRFDLTSQTWRQLQLASSSLVPLGPRLLFAMASFTLRASSAHAFIVHGGINGSYDASKSFNPGATGEHQVLSEAMLLVASAGQSERYSTVRLRLDLAGPAPPARCLHSLATGQFVSASNDLVLLGGVDETGRAMEDMWYIESGEQRRFLKLAFLLDGISSTRMQPAANDLLTLVNTCKPSSSLAVTSSDVRMELQGDASVLVQLEAEEDIAICLLDTWRGPAAWLASVAALEQSLGRSSWLHNATWSPVNGEASELERETLEGYISQGLSSLGLNAYQFDRNVSCERSNMSARCLRGVCQRRNESGGRWGSIYCGNVSSSSACPDGYVCSLPRPRHGHQSVVLSLEGKELLLVFGGEASLLAGGGEWVLTNSVTSVHFSYNDATSVDLLTSCDLGSSCPQPRRDASVLVMDNGGAGNGRLLVFGGLGCGGAGGSCSQSGLLDFLAGRPSAGAQLLDDLWYLDLQELSQDCVMTGDCQTFLPWTKVDVAGSKPSARFAGAVTIDVSDNELYLFGGVSYESGSFTELNDLNEFPLADPFYKFCSATGQGLTRAVAGVTSKIYLQCQDSFRRPADGARFRIELVSAGSPSLSISPVGLGQGMYEGSYTPVNSGSFLLSIFVGRGGAEHQSLIEGYDANPSNSLHEFQLLANRTNPNPFSLLVAAGTTDALVSTSSGSFLTLTTAGVASSFMLTAKDKHGNLSPGGDIVSVIMTLWDPARQTALEPDLKPETAAISDNSDGSYHVAYRITRAGAYRLSLSVNGQEGMGSPLLLEVASSPADPLRSYVFGDFSNIRTGVSSSLFVQTRDALGNPLRVDRALAPAGSENITFEFCTSVGLQDESVTCEGGSVDLNVGISVEYGISPDGYSSNRSTGMPNYGLYRITYFPFNDGLVYPQVRHGPVYVKCMFDTSGLSVDRMIPSPQEADDCIARILANETAKARRKSLLVAAHAPPRRISSYHHDYFNVQVQATFTSPDTHKLRFWLTWGPVLCGLLGFLLQLAYSLCVWKSRRDIAPVRTIPMSRRSSAVSQPYVQEDKGADSSFLQQLKAGGFLDEAEVGECSDEGKKEETLAIMKKFEMAQNEMISSLKRVARKQPSPSSLNTSSAQSVFILWQPKRSSVEVEEENLEDRTFYS